MSTAIAFVDCETTHLDAEIGEVWEVAVILREDNDPATDTEYVWEFAIDPDLADPESLRIGRWHERRQLPAYTSEAAFTGCTPAEPMSRDDAVKAILTLLRGTVLVGSNPGFDDRFLRKLLGPGSAQWHYRPLDVATLVAGWRLGMASVIRRFGGTPGPDDVPTLPYSSREMSRFMGVEPPVDGVAHTALGDARWCRDLYDAVNGGAAL
jgi:oligoribonuclease (3'-5' exoribonuclease)